MVESRRLCVRSPVPRLGWTALLLFSQPELLLRGTGKVPLHPWGLRRATDGRAGPRGAVPKPGPIPKFSLPSLVMSCPSLLHAQASSPPPAITKSTSRGPCPWGRHFRVESCPRPGTCPGEMSGFCSELDPEDLGSFAFQLSCVLSPKPP